ncbi:MAG: DUF5672 family protein [Bacteroidia bacterium]|nr:DUF5672 family protein [Bacteroidia bacterium]
MLVNVVIPVYLSTLSPTEVISLNQCLKVLKNHPITLATHREVDISVYQDAFLRAKKPFKVTYFDRRFFVSVFSYSQLLLCRDFYERFKEDEYILLYQLDGFVFRDELTEWCSKGFDYIGAPWLKHYGVNYDGNDLWKVGNGGVSLRKISTFVKAFDQNFPLKSSWFFIKSLRKKKFLPMLLKTLQMMLVLIFSNKSVEYILQNYTDERVNEDCFWAEAFQNTTMALNIPDVLTGAHFCLEQRPSYIFGLMGNQLPFTCHAFEKYEFETFWKEIIERVHAQTE